MSAGFLGQPLTDTYSVPGGEARLFEHGATITGAGGEAVVTFQFPMIGRPSIVSGDPVTTPVFETYAVRFAQGGWQIDELESMVRNALGGRLALVPTDQPPGALPLSLGALSGVTADIHGFEVIAAALQERQLYDVAVLADGGQWRVVAPHAVYHRRSWTDFGIAHVTDVHVARRIDRFRELLVQAGRHQAAAALYNWNDRFRGFVRYANYLHDTGMLDVILSTGDQYDYIFEDDDDPAAGGNAAFMRQLILGQAPGPDFPDVEELRVPIFMIPGNHDYRKHPYKLIFDLHVGISVFGFDVKRFTNYSGYNLQETDAKVLAARLDRLPTIFDFGVPVAEVGIDGAARMVAVDEGIMAYKQHLADRGSYAVRLGSHRIVMLDSGPDVGVLTSVMDGLRHLLGNTSEDEDTFASGSPNSEGVEVIELDMVAKALRETPADGLVILGIHTPLVNPVNEEYPYFLRETQRATQPDQVHAFLARNGTPLLDDVSKVEEKMKDAHPTWYPDKHDHRDPTFAKRVDRQDMLDFAVSRGKADELIRVAAGGGPRRVDLVLSGHTHYHNEFSIRPMHNGDLGFYMDFYTQNPVNYYPTRFTLGWKDVPPSSFNLPVTDKTHIEVLPGAPADGIPTPIDDAPLAFDLKVPPYPEPLESAADAREWWSNRRPLLLQTGALGPRKAIGFLSGFRMLSVKNNVIDRIHFVSTERLEAHDFRLPWEEAILPDVPGPPTRPWLSVSEGSGTPGGYVTAVPIGNALLDPLQNQTIALFLSDSNGGIYTASGTRHNTWGPWSNISEGSSTPGARLAAVPTDERITVLVADPGGGIYASAGSEQHGWGPWRSVSDGSTMPGGHVTAIRTGDNISVFLADAAGGIYATAGTYDGGWGPWTSVSEGSSTPGAPVAAVEIDDHVTLVLADPGGGIYANSGSYAGGWGLWQSVSDGSTIPGGNVSAVRTGDHITVVLADAGGGVFATAGTHAGGWGPWQTVSEGSTVPGGHVTAISIGGDRLILALADPAGGVYSTVGSYAGGWGPWVNVSEGSTIPGAPVAAVRLGDHTVFVLADPIGGIYARVTSRS